MKVLIVNTCYAFGSTGRIAAQEYDYLKMQGVDVYVAYAYDLDRKKLYQNDDHLFLFGNNVTKYVSAGLTRIFGDQLGHAYLSTLKLLGIIKKINPDIIHIHCVNAYSCNHYLLLNWLKKNHFPVVLTEHAEYYYTGNCSYVFECEQWKHGCKRCPNVKEAQKSFVFDSSHKNWLKMKEAMSGWNGKLAITTVSPWLMNKSMQSDITKGIPHYCICNGVDTSVFYLPEAYKNKSNYQYILFVVPGSMSGVKGGWYIIQLAKRLPGRKLVVIGTEKPEGTYPTNLAFISHTSNQQEMANYYRDAVVTVITSKRETFSMVVAESLCCGTPVVGFLCGGAESIALKDYSKFVKFGDVETLANAIEEIIGKKDFDRHKISKEAIEAYDSIKMCKGYYSLLAKMTDYSGPRK